MLSVSNFLMHAASIIFFVSSRRRHTRYIGDWISDVCSSDLTFLNKRRIHQPIRLSDRDQITIGDQVLNFRQPLAISEQYKTDLKQRTLGEIENIPCWLLEIGRASCRERL